MKWLKRNKRTGNRPEKQYKAVIINPINRMESSTPTIDIKNLTPEQKAEMMRQLEADKQAQEQAKQAEKDMFITVRNETVERVYGHLKALSGNLAEVKEKMLSDFDTLLEMKAELYGIDDKQQSHNWTSADGNVTIITGYNVKDRWDDTVGAGIARVQAWIDKQMTDQNKNIVEMVRDLLKPNKDGVLRANRVLDLQNSAERIGDKELIEAVKIIREAYRPDRSGSYIKAKYRDGDGNWQWLPLAMSQA